MFFITDLFGFYGILLCFAVLYDIFSFFGFYSNFLFQASAFFYFFLFFLVYFFYRNCFFVKGEQCTYWGIVIMFFIVASLFIFFSSFPNQNAGVCLNVKYFQNKWSPKFTLFDGPGLPHGLSFLVTSLLFLFSLVSFFVDKTNSGGGVKTKIITLNHFFIFVFVLTVYVLMSGGYWAFFSEVWGNWFNNDPIEIFFLYFFFSSIVVFHVAKNISFLKIFFIYVSVISSFFLWNIRLGYIGSKHASFDMRYSGQVLLFPQFETYWYLLSFFIFKFRKQKTNLVGFRSQKFVNYYSVKKPNLGAVVFAILVYVLVFLLCAATIQSYFFAKTFLANSLVFVCFFIFYWTFELFFVKLSAFYLGIHVFVFLGYFFIVSFISIVYFSYFARCAASASEVLSLSFYTRKAVDIYSKSISLETYLQQTVQNPQWKTFMLKHDRHKNYLSNIKQITSEFNDRAVASLFCEFVSKKCTNSLQLFKKSILSKGNLSQIVEVDSVCCVIIIFVCVLFFFFFF